MINKIIISCYIILLCIPCLHAQQEPLYGMYMMNGFLFNPALAGNDGYTTIGASSRNHMLGFENSPKTYVLSAQTRLLKQSYKINSGFFKGRNLSKRSGRVGLGAYIFNDHNGVVARTGGSITYAYHLQMQNKQFSLGVAASTFQFKIAQHDLTFRNNEPLSNESISNQMFVPDVTFGSYFLTPDAFAGFSITNLFQSRIKLGTKAYDYRMYRHYFLMAGKRFNPDDLYSYEPSFLLKATEKMIFQGDMQMRVYYKQDYYFGLCYRTGFAMGFLIGGSWNRLTFGYAFDYGITNIQKYSYGAHELNLALKLGDSARRYKWLIRY